MLKGLVVGLDLSLNATGVCFSLPNMEPFYQTFVPNVIKRGKKMDWRAKYDRLMEYWNFFNTVSFDGVTIADAELVVVEDYSYATSKSKTLTGFGEQRGMLYLYLAVKKLSDRFLLISAGGLKKFAIGTGRADKEIFVQRVARKYDRDFATSDECDAFCLTLVGRGVLDWKCNPIEGEFREKSPKIFVPAHLTVYQAEALLGSEFIREWLGVNKLGKEWRGGS